MFGFSYWFLPLFAGCVWLGTLLAMLGAWEAMGRPHYSEMASNQPTAYISDIGATRWGKPLFIAGSAVMVVIFDVTFISERWLRHKGRLQSNYGRGEKILSVFAIIFAVVGAAGLILLTIFDTKRHPEVHDAMLIVFIAGYVISAIFICAEYQRLGVHYRESAILRTSFWIKLGFIIVEVALAIAFGVTEYKTMYQSSAILEWVIALIYIFYVWSFIIDFLPAVHTRHKGDRFPPVRRSDDEMAMTTEAAGTMTGGPVYTSGGYGHNDRESYGSQQPVMQQNGGYNNYASQHASRNF
ncbi:hypothetical protein BAUCODRAFT_117653 [Baudoinia panamericana UAMH 10762]|uniref:CWH43-like N-terminal domain-containing protein n=1 Tax=Baudoinia panamericana (strain UAMH 10762) TaxID=717646 RepID=M2MJ45_BAUPA|nr:uncharacterized protein BAUCODRAFT_117653 [Baudoinia panamericana UAMH 10762]EMC91298.1 hypothetical protein BAUCODRAFT_117653 [Baudoinia panamericana UAMH 10762]